MEWRHLFLKNLIKNLKSFSYVSPRITSEIPALVAPPAGKDEHHTRSEQWAHYQQFPLQISISFRKSL